MNKIEIHDSGSLIGNSITVGENGKIELVRWRAYNICGLGCDNPWNIKRAGNISTALGETLEIKTGGILDLIDHENSLNAFSNVVIEDGANVYVHFINNDFGHLNIMDGPFVDGDITFGDGESDGGDLHLIFDEDFLPTPFTPLNVFTWSGSRTGMLDSIIVSEIGDPWPTGLSFQSLYNDGGSGSLVITIVPEPST